VNAISEHLAGHLHELRNRLIVCFAVVIVASGTAYGFAEQLADLFVRPLFNASPLLSGLVYTNLTEAFFSYLKLALWVGIGVSSPVLLYQAWRFAEPGLYPGEKKAVMLVVFFSTGLFAAGAAFSYFVVLPEMLSFLMGFAGENLTPMPKFGAYLTFVVRSAIAFGLAFEIPFVMTAAVRLGLVRRRYFITKRVYSYVGIVVIAFLLAAGDPVASVLLALPLCGLYEIGILVAGIFGGAAGKNSR